MKTFFTFIFLLFTGFIFSQTAPEIDWQNTIGGGNYDDLVSLYQTPDGGYMLAGESYSDISGDKNENTIGANDYWILKLNSVGSIEWQKTIGSGTNDFLYCTDQTSDGGFIIGGHTSGGISGDKTEVSKGSSDYWIIKLNLSGNIEWQNTIGGSASDQLLSIHQTLDGGYIVGGASFSGISGDKTENSNGSYDIWVIKLDSHGDIQWQNTIGGDYSDVAYSVRQTADEGFIVCGYSASGISDDKTEACLGSTDIWIIKLDSDGSIEWQNTIGGSGSDSAHDIKQTSDGGFIVAGNSTSPLSGDKTEDTIGLSDFWILKLDSFGLIEWQKTIGGTNSDGLSEIQLTADGGYVLAGISKSPVSGNKTEACQGSFDYWILKLDSTGAIKWDKTIGGSLGEAYYRPISMQQTQDGGFILGGGSDSGISGDKTEGNMGFGTDYWIVKLYPEEIACLISSTITPSGPTSFCAGDNVILNAPVDASYTYQWKKNGVNISGATTSSFTANVTGQYQVYITNGTCDDISDSLLVIKNPKPNPAITNVDVTNDLCFDAAIKLKTAVVAGGSYQWYKGATVITGATTNVYLATMPGNYKVKVTNSAGCFKLSLPYMIVKTCKMGEIRTSSDISVYPNPNNGSFTIELGELLLSAEMQINVRNMLGEVVYTERVHTSDKTWAIDLDKNIADGIYLIEINAADQIFSKQMVITK